MSSSNSFIPALFAIELSSYTDAINGFSSSSGPGPGQVQVLQ